MSFGTYSAVAERLFSLNFLSNGLGLCLIGVLVRLYKASCKGIYFVQWQSKLNITTCTGKVDLIHATV